MKITRKGLYLLFFYLFLSYPSLLLASTPCCSASPVYGPVVYQRDTGKPVVVDTNFSVANSGQYTLCIINGDNAGNNRVSSAVISINGVEVASPNEFNQQVGSISKPVTLNKDNLISVEVRSSPGSYITVTILGPPKINITFPTNEATISDTSITVTGTIDDNSAQVTVNGVSATVSNGTFSANITLVEGQNTITITATNQCGFTTTQSITVTKTTIPKGPALNICVITSEIREGACNGATVYQNWDAAWFYGQVDDPQAELKINGIAVDIYDDGSFFFDLEPLKYGPNSITATATNASGTTSANLTIIYDNIPPKVTITSPSNDAIVNTSSITVTGTVVEDYLSQVWVNDITASVNNGIFVAENVPLTEGKNEIWAGAEDKAYNIWGSDAVTVYYTSSTSGGSIYGRVSDALSGNAIINASITITDSTRSQTVSTASNGYFSIANITPGTITGTVSKSGYLTYAFTETIKAGEILLIDISLIPAARIYGAVTNEETGQGLQGATISVTDSQGTLTATTDTYGSYSIGGIAQGTVTVNISKTGYLTQDHYLTVAAGGAYRLDIQLKGESPGGLTIQITSPSTNSTIYGDRTIVSGVIGANTSDIGVTVNGKIAAIVGSKFVVNDISIETGQNTITAKLTDISGNSVSTSITVYGETSQQYIRLNAAPESGVTTLNTKLTVESSLDSITNYSLSSTGPAEIATISKTEFDLKITTEGIYYITYTATDTQNKQYSDTIAIAAISRDTIDNLLKGKWGVMKGALEIEDIENALTHLSEGIKERYRQIFTQLQSRISSIASGMQTIQLIYLKDGVAKYRIKRQEAAGDITYYIYFEQDKNGIWRIARY